MKPVKFFVAVLSLVFFTSCSNNDLRYVYVEQEDYLTTIIHTDRKCKKNLVYANTEDVVGYYIPQVCSHCVNRNEYERIVNICRLKNAKAEVIYNRYKHKTDFDCDTLEEFQEGMKDVEIRKEFYEWMKRRGDDIYKSFTLFDTYYRHTNNTHKTQ